MRASLPMAFAVIFQTACRAEVLTEAFLPDNSSLDAGVAVAQLSLGTPTRPAVVVFAQDRDVAIRAPLFVLLHGYGASAAATDEFLGLTALTLARDAYLLLPDSEKDSAGLSFWNATDACCDFGSKEPNDVDTLKELIHRATDELPIDEARIFVLGYSNGGFMAYRLACELGNRIAAIAVFAGAGYEDPTLCDPTTAVSVLHLHGDEDDVIAYGGGSLPALDGSLHRYPSAPDSVAHWAVKNQCDTTPEEGAPLDLTSKVTEGTALETIVANYESCRDGSAVSLWTLRDEGHTPAFHPTAFGRVLDWLEQRPK